MKASSISQIKKEPLGSFFILNSRELTLKRMRKERKRKNRNTIKLTRRAAWIFQADQKQANSINKHQNEDSP